MKLVPALLKNIAGLSWRGALGALEYQRLRIRVTLLSLLPASLVVLAGGAYMVWSSAQQAPVSPSVVYAIMGLGVLALAFIIWLVVVTLKIEILRLRGLGFSRWTVWLPLMLLAWLAATGVKVADEIASSPELLLTGMVPYEVYRWLSLAVFLQIGVALYDYLMYLEETPLRTSATALLSPFAKAPGKGENILLFLLQTWVWFGILTVPMYFIIAHIL